MATKNLSANATYVERGYGQVEPNHLSAQRTAQIYAQLPANKNITVLENGMFVKYDYLNKEVNFTGDGEWMLVYNEVKIYDAKEVEHDFAMIKENYGGTIYSAYPENMAEGTTMVPRVFKTNIGDIFTTNTIAETELAEGDELVVGDNGYLTKTAGDNAGDMKWQVVKVYTMPDMQKGVKIMRIA